MEPKKQIKAHKVFKKLAQDDIRCRVHGSLIEKYVPAFLAIRETKLTIEDLKTSLGWKPVYATGAGSFAFGWLHGSGYIDVGVGGSGSGVIAVIENMTGNP